MRGRLDFIRRVTLTNGTVCARRLHLQRRAIEFRHISQNLLQLRAELIGLSEREIRARCAT